MRVTNLTGMNTCPGFRMLCNEVLIYLLYLHSAYGEDTYRTLVCVLLESKFLPLHCPICAHAGCVGDRVGVHVHFWVILYFIFLNWNQADPGDFCYCLCHFLGVYICKSFESF